MNRTRISPVLAGVLVALAIPTGVVAALEAVMVDKPDQQEPPTTPQILPEDPLTGPVDPETEPPLPDLSADDGNRPAKGRTEKPEKPAKKEPADKKGKPDKEEPEDTLVSVPTGDPLVGAVELETPAPIAEACAALAGGKCPVDDVTGTVEEILAEKLTPPVTEVLRPSDPVEIPEGVELPDPIEIPEAIDNSDPEADALARANAEAVRALLTALGLPVPEALGPPQS